MESVELSLDLSLLFSCVKHVLGRFSIVPCEFPTSVFRCSPLDLWSFMVNSVDLGLGCSPLDLRSTMVELGLPCISRVFWIDGSIFSVIALLIASCIWKFKLVLISFNLLEIWLDTSSLIILVVSIVTWLFSLLFFLIKT